MQRRDFLKYGLGAGMLLAAPNVLGATVTKLLKGKEVKGIITQLDEMLKPPSKIMELIMSPEKVREFKVACRRLPDYPKDSSYATTLSSGEKCVAYRNIPIFAAECLSGSEVMLGAHQLTPNL